MNLRLRHRPTLVVGVAFIGLIVLTALVSFVWTPGSPYHIPGGSRLLGPSLDHWLGTDRLGRDVASRLMVGARTTLYVGVVAVGLSAVIGTPLGILAGMRRGRIDTWLMRGNDLLLAFPALLLAVMFSAAFGASTLTAMLAIGIATVPAFARIVRAGTLQIMSTDYILAARSAGRRPAAIAVFHVLPNVLGLVIVQASVSFAIAVLAEAGLSFLGFGTPPPTPSWGRMLAEAQDVLFTDPWLAVWPGAAIALAVLGFNLAGDGLRDLYDPRLSLPRDLAVVQRSAAESGAEVLQDRREGALVVEDLRVRVEGRELVGPLTFSVGAGERVGLIGESGSGKSLTALAILRLLDEGLAASGSVRLGGVRENLLDLRENDLADLRGNAASMVFQEPLSALNPVQRVGDQVAEAIRIHRRGTSRKAAQAKAVELLRTVQLQEPEHAARAYPHQLSGGMRQRAMIAMALANDPGVLICDEPTSALDVTVQAQILELICRTTAEREAGLLFISHDLAVVATVCDRVLVIRDGEIVESGPVGRVLTAPEHPYTRELIAASALKGLGGSEEEPSPAEPVPPIVAVERVGRTFRRYRSSLWTSAPPVQALDNVDLEILPGQRFGVVGESGSGKSTLVRLIAGLDRPTTGTVRFAGRDITGVRERDLRFLREDLQMVFQDPTSSLDPRLHVRDIVAEPLHAQGRTADVEARVAEMLAAVGLPDDAATRYPHQFSGGQRQRISIARALAPRPRVLVADEPVSALDASIRASILDLLAELVRAYDLTLVFVSHDLDVVRHICDVVAVLENGRIVEHGPTERVYTAPEHPYTKRLLAAVPTIDRALHGATATDLVE